MKAETKWTPGPLLSDAEGYVFKDDALGTQVANCAGAEYIPPAERTANAKLYAAAPELYGALEEISDALEGARAANPEATIEYFDELVEIEPGWRKRLKSALAKARGEANA